MTDAGLPRALTKGDWIEVWVQPPGRPEQVSGGRYDGMSITSSGKICIDYLTHPEEGFAMSDYLGWITRIELSDEEEITRPIVRDEP
jgi:hypothetical protein